MSIHTIKNAIYELRKIEQNKLDADCCRCPCKPKAKAKAKKTKTQSRSKQKKSQIVGGHHAWNTIGANESEAKPLPVVT